MRSTMLYHAWKVGDVFKSTITAYEILEIDDYGRYKILQFKDSESFNGDRTLVVTLEMLHGFFPLTKEEAMLEKLCL